MLNTLSDRLSEVLKKVRGWGSLSEKNIKEGIRDIKLALLEADVNYKVVKEFVDNVTAKAMGEEVLKSLTPSQQFTKIVYDCLVNILGGDLQDRDDSKNHSDSKDLSLKSGLSILMLVGLQGSGKTLTSVKVAKFVEKNYNKRPLLVAADVKRPAAVEQLELLSVKSGFSIFKKEDEKSVVICREAIKYAKNNSYGAVIIDTAGRLEIDEGMMAELVEIKKFVEPQEILLVADAATGQVAVTVAKGFHEKLGITGIILSRMDSDARGGAALSMSYITGQKINFIGTGEKVEDLEEFYPSRIASRILNMGDVVTLVEKVQKDVDLESAKRLEKKLKMDTFDFNDFLEQIKQLRKMGPLENILDMIPGLPDRTNIKIDEREMKRTEAIINSMTEYEREHYKIINGSRRKRIALGSGTSVFEVNRLLNNFMQIKKMMKKMGKSGKPRLNMLSSLMRHN